MPSREHVQPSSNTHASIETLSDVFPIPTTFGEYHEQLLAGRNDPQNAADRVLRALTNPSRHITEELPNGPIYHVFDQRTDGLEVYGMHEAKRSLMDALRLSAHTGGAENIIMLVLPSGAGKSTMLEIIKRELIKDTRQNPLLTIDGCPTKETPDHLLTDEERQELLEKTGRIIHGELCAHCQAMLEKQDGDRSKMPIKAIRLTENAGISELDPRLTKPNDWRTQEYIAEVVLRAAGGMLRIPEFVKQGKVTHEGLMDFYRGVPERKVTDARDGSIHRVDCLVIGDTTVQEFEAFFDSDSEYIESEAMQALKDRMLVVKAPHNLSVSEEVKIYEKMLKAGNLLEKVHVSPHLLESLAEIAVQTRLLDSDVFEVLTKSAKVALYDGKDVAGFERNRTNVTQLQEESRESDEGLEGISPPFLRRNVLLPLFSAALTRGYDNPRTGEHEQGCVTPLEAFRTIKQAIEDASYELGYVYGNDYEKIIEQVQAKYEKWLIETTSGAFNKRYKEAFKTKFEDYIETIGRLLSREDETTDSLDTTSEPLHVARHRAEDLENQIFGYVVSEESRTEFRKAVDREVTKLILTHRQQGDPAFAEGTQPQISLLLDDEQKGVNITMVVKGIREIITGTEENGEDLLRMVLPGHTLPPEHLARIEEARVTLMQEYGFCPCCTDKLMEYAASRLPKKATGMKDARRRSL